MELTFREKRQILQSRYNLNAAQAAEDVKLLDEIDEIFRSATSERQVIRHLELLEN